MATKKKKRAAAKKNPKKKRARARAANPKKKRARARATNPKKKRAGARATNPKKRARSRARNPKKARRRRNARRRRSNPGWGNLGVIVGGLAVGVVAGIGSAWINAGPLGNRRMAAQNGVLLAEGAAAAYFIENPVFAVSAVIGIFIVPIASFIYKAAPMLASPTPWGQPTTVVVVGGANGPPPPAGAAPTAALPAPSVATATSAAGTPAGTMAALHQANVRRMRALDESMDQPSIAALHRGVAALHRGVGALHRKGHGVGALHHPTMGALHMGAAVGFSPVHVSRLPHQSSTRTSRT